MLGFPTQKSPLHILASKHDEDNENRRCFCFRFDRCEQNNQAYYFNTFNSSERFEFCTTNVTLCYIKFSGIPSGDKDAIPHGYTLLRTVYTSTKIDALVSFFHYFPD